MIDTLPEKYVVSDKAFEMTKRFSMDVDMLCLKNLKAPKLCGELPEDAV